MSNFKNFSQKTNKQYPAQAENSTVPHDNPTETTPDTSKPQEQPNDKPKLNNNDTK